MPKRKLSYDQTSFASMEPGMESVGAPQQHLPKEKESESKKKSNTTLLAGLSFGILLFLVSVLFLLTSSGQQIMPPIPEESPQPSASSQVTGPLSERALEIRAELQEADPSIDELPLPPVDFDLALD